MTKRPRTTPVKPEKSAVFDFNAPLPAPVVELFPVEFEAVLELELELSAVYLPIISSIPVKATQTSTHIN